MTIPAAQYVRMSTDLQQYSIDNQKQTIQQYAEQHGFLVVKTYADEGRSGVILRGRGALRQLLTDVLSGNASYHAILVYDVSRWGRFQDADESAHYEFLCKHAGIPVHYCAETFPNDGTLPSSIFKALKRTMAAEYSRELGVKVYNAQKRLVLHGFKMGGIPGYGLRRFLISADGKRNLSLNTGERKSIAKDHVILVPGPKKEVDCIRAIFKMALNGYTFSEIARRLNGQRITYLGGRPWTPASISRTLQHPKYAGFLVWARTSFKLQSKYMMLPREQWVMVPRAFKPIIDQKTFDRVQEIVRERTTKMSSQEMLDALKTVLHREGRLTEDIIKRAPETPGLATYHGRFGGFRHVYELLATRLRLATSSEWIQKPLPCDCATKCCRNFLSFSVSASALSICRGTIAS